MERKNFYYLVSVLMIISVLPVILSVIPSSILLIMGFFRGIFSFYPLSFLITEILGIIILLWSSIYYIRNAKNKKLNNKIYYSAILYLISFIVGVIGTVLAFIPCFSGPADGFCMLGILYVIPAVFLLWIVAFVLFLVGRASQSK